jgi:tetrathionate reductase subunit B
VPYCVYNCPTGATYKRKDGIVAIDSEACIGCGYCVDACPYGARFIDPARGIAEKCDFCTERLVAGREPLCVEVCPSQVRTFGDLHDPKFAKLVKTKGARPIVSERVSPAPAVFYKGLGEKEQKAYAPHPPREASASKWLRILVNPAVKWMVGLAFAGQAVAYFYQLWHGEKQFEDEE